MSRSAVDEVVVVDGDPLEHDARRAAAVNRRGTARRTGNGLGIDGA